jgi:hypothetical protein
MRLRQPSEVVFTSMWLWPVAVVLLIHLVESQKEPLLEEVRVVRGKMSEEFIRSPATVLVKIFSAHSLNSASPKGSPRVG